jgi:hypothetical protein
MAASTNYRQILSQMADSLKPGGEIDKAMMSDIDRQGQLMSSQLGGSAIGRGFGNAQVGIPSQVFKHVSQAKSKARSDLMDKYMGVMSNLAQMAFSEEQGGMNRGVQMSQIQGNQALGQGELALRGRGYNNMGQPLSGTPGEASMNESVAKTQEGLAQANYYNAQAGQFNNQFPSLAAAGGAGQSGGTEAGNLYGLQLRGSQAPASMTGGEPPEIHGDWSSASSGGDDYSNDLEYF